MISKHLVSLLLVLALPTACMSDEEVEINPNETMSYKGDFFEHGSYKVRLCNAYCNLPSQSSNLCVESSGWRIDMACKDDNGQEIGFPGWYSNECDDVQYYLKDQDCPGVIPPAPRTSSCSGLAVRKSVHQLSGAEQQTFVQAWNDANQSGALGEIVARHSNSFDEAHNNPNFLPWHRAFLLEMEAQIQLIDPCMGMPYWDWLNQPGWPSFLRNDQALPSVIMPDGNPNLVEREQYQSFDIASSRNFYNTEVVPVTEFLSYAEALESLHGDFHNFVGGTMRDGLISPADPTFFLHHAFVDKLWTDKVNPYAGMPNNRLNAFRGKFTSEYNDMSRLGYRYQ